MYCMHCGQALPPDAFFCPHCGAKLPGGPQPAGNERAETGREPEEPPKIDCGLSLSIVAFCLGGVIGIIALIFAILATDKYRSGGRSTHRAGALVRSACSTWRFFPVWRPVMESPCRGPG